MPFFPSFAPLCLSRDPHKQAHTHTQTMQTTKQAALCQFHSKLHASFQLPSHLRPSFHSPRRHHAHHNHSTRLSKIPATTYVHIFTTNAAVTNLSLFAAMPHYNLFTSKHHNPLSPLYNHRKCHVFVEHSPQPQRTLKERESGYFRA